MHLIHNLYAFTDFMAHTEPDGEEEADARPPAPREEDGDEYRRAPPRRRAAAPPPGASGTRRRATLRAGAPARGAG